MSTPAASTADHATPAGAPLFMDAVLTPNRSLPKAGFIALMIAIIAMAVIAGAFYVTLGAWPVIGFMGVDILLVLLAFHLSYRQGRVCEMVQVTPQEVRVARRHPNGRTQSWSVSPYWARVHVERRGEHAVRVILRSHGEGAELGSFLSPREREDFADALSRALATARETPAPQADDDAPQA